MTITHTRLPDPIVLASEFADGLYLVEMLSPRELEVLSLVVAGHTNKQIGAALHIAATSARDHVAAILAKLNARNRTDAVRIALQTGLVVLSEPASAQHAIALSAYYAALAQKLLQEGRP